jgi:hypothetical protein
LKFRRAGWACGYDKADRECVQNSVTLTSWKTSTLKIVQRSMEDDKKTDLMETGCQNENMWN